MQEDGSPRRKDVSCADSSFPVEGEAVEWFTPAEDDSCADSYDAVMKTEGGISFPAKRKVAGGELSTAATAIYERRV